ncbi:MAG: adenylyltransferase/cytidyltransferase family protein [Patescibacteria group bacterium]|nr:adenylyltransferase/cytidyltransferase family protein [Patescibacteria group bacterium]
MKTVLASGTFDLFHPGHAAYLQQAATLGDYLIVVVARDVNVQKIKNKQAGQGEEIRRKKINDFLTSSSLPGRAVLGFKGERLAVIKKYKPDIIALGYDQSVSEKKLQAEIELLGLKTKIKRLKSHYPEKYKTSLMIN